MSLSALERRSSQLAGTLLAAALVSQSCAAPGSDEAVGRRPNVLLILVDDLRPDLGAYGHPSVVSPAIDRLAEQGMAFDRAYAQFPACNPSRTSLLTGLRPDTTGVLDNRTPFTAVLPEVVTLPQLFRDSGYFTAAIGKIFHGSGRKGGWTAPQAWDVQAFPRAGRSKPASADKAVPSGRVGRYSWRAVPDDVGGLQDPRVISRAVEVLEQVRHEAFFVAVGLTATHPHFVAPARFFELYPLESISLPAAPHAELAARLLDLQGWSDEGPDGFSEQQERELIRAYWACVSFVDAQIGRLLEALDRLDLSRDTIVILASDHGYHLGEQGWWSKRTLFEASTRVPLILRVPWSATRGHSARLVELVDLYPTLAELAGLTPPPSLEGTSLVPLLDDPDREWKSAARSQLTLGRIDGRSVRTERWRYTEWNSGDRGVELYDLAMDATEGMNLAEDPVHQKTRSRLREMLK